jgi:signal transduction histidine kinase
MNLEPEATGLALLCDEQGRLVRVIRDELGVAGRLAPGQPFTLIVDRASLSKALSFLVALRANEAAYDWEMNLWVPNELVTLHFAGGLVGGQLLIVASKTRDGARQLYEDLLLVSNEQTNALRAALQEQAESARAQAEREGALYDEISRLNNELVAMQRELARKNAELEKLNQLKNQFLGMAAHDLRNPLNIILSYSEFLLDEAAGRLSQEHLQFLDAIRSSSDFMVGLVNNLLDVAQIESGQLQLDAQPTDLIALIERNVALNRVLAEKKHIQLMLEVLPRRVVLPLDAAKIEQVLNNLISNAVKYSYPNSAVRVSVLAAPGCVTLAVQDQGQGIPQSEMDKLFKPFSRTSVKSTAGEKSTGLGLVIARKIVEGHQGRLWAESQVGVGSTFYVSLPVAEQGEGGA